MNGPPGGFAKLKAIASGIGKPKPDPLSCFRNIIRLDALGLYPHSRIGVRYAREALRIPYSLSPSQALHTLDKRDSELTNERDAIANDGREA